MNETIYFNTNQPLDKTFLENFLRDTFQSREFVWVADIWKYFFDHEIAEQTTYISLETGSEGFKYTYAVFASPFGHQSLREQINTIKQLSQQSGIEILYSDDEVNPWTRVFIEPNGQTSTIQSKDPNELTIDKYYNFPFGDFRTTFLLNPLQLEQLRAVVKNLYPAIDIDYATDGPIINGDFNKVKHHFKQLTPFDHHYEIRPIGKTEWLDREEKSEQFISLMTTFQQTIREDLCIFPRNFFNVQNIPGGTDSEAYCLLLTNTGSEKIIYKHQRNTWL